ncbi:hypothetical protein TRFO_26525 [Tritrichomonas foetus]|uniref:Uncharacterized protein n=1 Tax=Tritrichomonas foetus TaxID=1144522 RepID=A0A1J4K3U3_9EUKA|nr:hypothetical protein TRFO_26525 [Tritrichomonas foetus]|eukprot:OHT05642.1 hypothetical protein TRFO_26525 [Tritrichomonas foetus]
MIFGIADNAYANYEPPQDDSENDQVDPLDAQIESLKNEIRAIEKEIQVREAAKQLNEDSTAEQKAKEISDLERQIASFTKAIQFEQKRVAHFQSEITKREGKPVEAPPPDMTDETVAAIKSQNDQLQSELEALYKDIQNEVGEDFDIDKMLQQGSTAKNRADELQKLKAEYAKRQSQAVDSRIRDGVGQAADRVSKELDQLLQQKAELEVGNETMKNSISKARQRCDALEEESRALRMMDVLLNEKLTHDRDLLIHLMEIKEKNTPAELPEEDTPPVTEEFVEQLRSQLNIIKGLNWKLVLAQKDLDRYTIDESFSFLADQLGQLNARCQQLVEKILKREASETQKIEQHIEYETNE